MKIAVLIKYYKGEINPFDAAALECALESGAEVTALSMAPASVAPSLENLTRLGIKAVLITDPAYAGGDTQATSYVLSEALKRLDPDLIFAGRQSIDGDTSQVPPMLAERLGCGITVGVMEFDGEKITTRSNKSETLSEKTVYTFERIRALRFPSIFSKKGTVEIWDNDALKLDTKKCGIKGSPTRVIRSYASSVGRRSCRFASPDELEALISKSMTKSIDKNSDETVAKTDRIYYVGDIGDIARKFAFEAVSYDASGKDARKVAEELSGLGAKVVLFESNEEYKTLAARVAVICGSGLCADCISFRQEKNTFIMTRPALDGGVTADIACDSKMSLATVRKSGSADGELIFAIGRGAVPYIEKIRALAKKYHAQLAATRTVVDSGDMPYEYQVGLTGKTVSPKVYVAFGISGAVQHTSAISGAGTVIAVNTDKDARIFDYADYGIIEEIENVRL